MLGASWIAARFKRSRIILAVLVFTVLGLLLVSHGVGAGDLDWRAPSHAISQHPRDGSLHLLVPATSSNVEACRLFLSAAILNYPRPILINWGAKENKDAYVQHLAKVWTILAYLDRLHDHGRKDDMVLIVDGFDVHFQLPPEVMLRRYFQLNKEADERAAERVGWENMETHGLKQTVIFGHDKLCWPMDDKRPACWAVPEASDPKFAFGPYTDHSPDKARARWLNSGTIMGTVDEVRDVFKETLDYIHKKHETDSDQFYFANVFAAQEYARRLFQPDPFGDVKGRDLTWPVLEKGQRTEFFIGLDYEGFMFQTMAFFRPYISWMTFNGKDKQPIYPKKQRGKKPKNVQVQDAFIERVLPDDVRMARPPFVAGLKHHPALPHPKLSMPSSQKENSSITTRDATPATPAKPLPIHLTWRDITLGVNVISNNIFPLLHFTGPKEFRGLWWKKLWFIPYAEDLLKASIKMPREPISREPIGGRIWWPAEMEGKEDAVLDLGEKGGAWADSGEFLGWDELCGKEEDAIFLREKKEGEKKEEEKKEDEKKEEEKKEEEKKEDVKEDEKIKEEKKEDVKKEDEKKEDEKKQEGKKEGQ